MLSAVNGPEALVAWVADRPDRVASVDCVGVGVVVCCGHDVPMLRETAVPAVQSKLALENKTAAPEALDRENGGGADAEVQSSQCSIRGLPRLDHRYCKNNS